jgi:cellulose synthase/poly-beta-1,6-N-acetylglucosamine synthase-like glycosyltransferase
MRTGASADAPKRPAEAPNPPPTNWSAERTLTAGQALAGAALLALFGLWLAKSPAAAGAAAAGAATVGFLATTMLRVVYFLAGYRARGGEEEGEEDPEGGPLPTYSVLVPLYREAEVVPALLAALDRLDYPFDRLEVVLLVEHDDRATESACRRHLRPGWRILTVPAGHPRTKPRALNAGLPELSGEFFTIYDAEDRPEPDQLRKAVRRFRRLPERVVCLQARLDYYNSHQNLLTRWFTCEYATHFSLYLEGIAALDHPMPLGGTSCHFRTEAIRGLGGWDSWNVTEDCELGMRLAAAGLTSRTLDSVTWEEAVPTLGRWVRQRSRWVKGFAQTALVLLRSPLKTARAMGGGRYLAALATVGGVPLVSVSQIAFWGLLWAYVGLRAGGADVGAVESLFPEPLLSLGMASLLLGNFCMLLATVSVVYQQGRYELVRYAVAIPAYWTLVSVGAWRGVLQLLRRPHFWEKTTHGLAKKRADSEQADSQLDRKQRDPDSPRVPPRGLPAPAHYLEIPERPAEGAITGVADRW